MRAGSAGEESTVELNLKRKVVIGATTLAAAAFAGGAYAATQDDGTNARQAFLNDVAKRLSVTPQQLNAALGGAVGDQLSAAVAAGKLTQAEANAIKQRLQQGDEVPLGGLLMPRLPGGKLFFFGGGSGPPSLFHGPSGGPPMLFHGPVSGGLDTAAKYLGLTPAQLRAQLEAGKSLAQIAKARGKSVSGLKSAMLGAARSGLDQAVKDKVITSAQEQRILSRLTSRLDNLVNRAPELGRRFGFDEPGGPPTPPGAPSVPPAAFATPPGAPSPPDGPPGPPIPY
jgi:hypothetical protein